MARGPGLRWAIPFALVTQGVSFQLVGSPIVSKIAYGGASWRGTTTRRPFRCNHVRVQDAASGTGAGTGSEAGYREAREDLLAQGGSSPLIEYFARWVHPSGVWFVHDCTVMPTETGSQFAGNVCSTWRLLICDVTDAIMLHLRKLVCRMRRGRVG